MLFFLDDTETEVLLEVLGPIFEAISGFSFAETFPEITADADNVTSEIIDGIESQFGKHVNFKQVTT